MSMSSIKDCLHPDRADMKLVNVKFFRGDNSYITPDEFRAQLCATAAQKRSNPSARRDEAPRSARQKINVRELVATL